jgi:hypothetical protein
MNEMPPFPDIADSLRYVFFPLFSAVISLLAFLVQHNLRRAMKVKQEVAKTQVDQLRLKLVQTLPTSAVERAVERSLQQILSTSGAQAPVGIAEGHHAIDELRDQIALIEEQIRNHRNEIVEITKIDPVLEATVKVSIDNLTKRIEFLEKSRLEKWDVALVFIQLLGAVGVLFGIALGVFKLLHP